jgi:hypothetical protein
MSLLEQQAAANERCAKELVKMYGKVNSWVIQHWLKADRAEGTPKVLLTIWQRDGKKCYSAQNEG